MDNAVRNARQHIHTKNIQRERKREGEREETKEIVAFFFVHPATKVTAGWKKEFCIMHNHSSARLRGYRCETG